MTVNQRQNEDLCPLPPKADWLANWIWMPECTGYPARNSYAFFRKRFVADGKLTINIAADTRYELHIDGMRVGRGTAPSVVAYKMFDTYSTEVGPGEHIIAVLVHHLGETCATAQASRPGLVAEISTVTGGIIAFTDSNWRVLAGNAFDQDLPCMMSHFGFYEICDYKLIPEGWNGLDFEDEKWSRAQVIGEVGCDPWTRLVPRDIPQLATTVLRASKIVCLGRYDDCASDGLSESLVTVAVEMAGRARIDAGESGVSLPIKLGGRINEYVALDFGREVTGHVRLCVSGVVDGQQIDIGYDEMIDTRGLPDPRRQYVHFADRFFLQSGQREIEVFDARGFRYLLIDVPSGKGGIVLDNVEVDERTYPVTKTGRFSCSDTALEQLYATGLETTRLCMLDTYVDCPSRERVMWMDSYLEGLCSSFGMGITDLWRRTLYVFAQNVVASGEMAGAVKGYAPTDLDTVIDTFMMYYVCSVADYYAHTADRQSAEALFPSVMEQFKVLEQYATPEGLHGGKLPSWSSFLDWSAMDCDGISAGVNAVYLVALRKAAGLAKELGKTDESEQLILKHRHILKEFKRSFWSESEGLFVDAIHDGKLSEARSQLTNTLAIWAGVAQGDEARGIIRRITDKSTLLPPTPGDYRLQPDFKCQTDGIVPIGTPAQGTVLAKAMLDLGMDKEAMDYLRKAWAPLARNKTFAEHFVFDKNSSLCHGWSACPVMLMPRYVLGICPVEPGWRVVQIDPHPGDLKWAEGSVPTPLGEISVTWEVIDGRIRLDVKSPDGMTILTSQEDSDFDIIEDAVLSRK